MMSESPPKSKSKKPRSLWFKFLITLVFSLLVVLAVPLAFVLTETGNRQLVNLARNLLPTLNIGSFNGTFLTGFSATDVSFSMPGVYLHLSQIETRLQLHCLWRNQICLAQTRVNQLTLDLSPPPETGSDVPNEAATQSVGLGRVSLPLQLTLNGGQINQIHYKDGTLDNFVAVGAFTHFDRVDWNDIQLTTEQLSWQLDGIGMTLNGQLEMDGDWPLDMAVRGFLIPLANDFHYQGQLSGSVIDMNVALDYRGYGTGNLNGTVRPLDAGLPMNVQLYPSELPDNLQTLLSQLQNPELQLNGQLPNYQLGINGIWETNDPDLESLPVRGQAQMDFDHLWDIQLDVGDRNQDSWLSLSNSIVRWLPELEWQLEADSQHFPLPDQILAGTHISANIRSQMSWPEIDRFRSLRGQTEITNFKLVQPEQQLVAETAYLILNDEQQQLELKAHWYQAGLPATQLSAQLQSQNFERWQLVPLSLTTDQSSADITGQVTFNLDQPNRVDWSVNGRINQLAPQVWVPSVEGLLNGQMSTDGLWQQTNDQPANWQLNVDAELSGQLLQQPLDLLLAVHKEEDQPLTVKQLYLNWFNSQLTGQGMADAQGVAVELHSPSLSVWHPDLSGPLSLTGHIGLTTPDAARSLDLNYLFANLQTQSDEPWAPGFQSVVLQQPQASMVLQRHPEWTANVSLQAEQLLIANDSLGSLDAQLDGTLPEHRLSLNLQAVDQPLMADLVGQWQPADATSDFSWQATLNQSRLGWRNQRWTLQQPTSLQLDSASVQIGDQCWRSDDGQLCLSDIDLQQGIQLIAQLNQWRPNTLLADLDTGIQWQTELTGSVDLSLSTETVNAPDSIWPTLTMKLNSTPGTFTLQQTPYQLGDGTLQLALDSQSMALTGLLSLPGQAPLQLSVQSLSTQQGVDDLQLQLRQAKPILTVSDGLLNWQRGLQWQFDAELDLDASWLLDLPLMAQGTFESSGQWQSDNIEATHFNLSWQQLQVQQDQHRLYDGQGTLSNQIGEWLLSHRQRQVSPLFPDSELTLTASMNGQQWRLSQFSLNSLQGQWQARASGQTQPPYQWQSEVQITALTPEWWVEELPGILKAQLYSQGQWQSDKPLASQHNLTVSGDLRDYPLLATSSLNLKQLTDWQIVTSQLKWGDNQLELAGDLADQGLEWSLAASNLKQILPDLKGDLALAGTLVNPLKAPELTINARSNQIQWRQLTSQNTRLQLNTSLSTLDDQIPWPDRWQAELSLNSDDWRWLEQSQQSMQLTASLNQGQFNLKLNDQTSVGHQLILDGQWRAASDRSPEQINATLHRGRAQLPEQLWTIDQPVQINWRPQNWSVSPHCWRWQSASFCLDRLKADPWMTISAKWNQVPVDSIAQWLTSDWQVTGGLDSELDLSQSEQGWNGVISATVDQGTVSTAGTESSVLWQYDALAAKLTLTPNQVTQTLSVQIGDEGLIAVQAQIDPSQRPMPLSGDFRMFAIPLSLASPFLHPQDQIRGVLTSEGELSGTLTEPQIQGQLAIRNGELKLIQYPLALTRLSLDGQFTGEELSWTSQFVHPSRTDKKPAQLDGTFRWSPQWQLYSHIKAEQWPLSIEPYADLFVSTDMKVTVSARQTDLKGDLFLDRGNIQFNEIPEQAITVSEDVRMVGEQPPEPTPLTLLTADVNIRTRNPLVFSGYGLTGNLSGDLKILDDLDTQGRVSVDEGLFRAYGQKLTLTKANLNFIGPIDRPLIDAEATRKVDDYLVGIRITGSLENPDTQVFSQPPLPQDRALTYLILGRSFNVTQSDQNLVNQAALSLGLLGTTAYTQALAEELGLRDFVLESEGAGDETQLVASTQISPRLSLRYGMNLFGEGSQIGIRYKLTSQFFLEAVRGYENALDLFYSVEYD